MEKPWTDPDRCPHCGALLLTRHDRRQHLSLQTCQRDPLFDERRPARRADPALDEGWPPARDDEDEPQGP